MKRHIAIGLLMAAIPALAQKPVIADGGVLNAASFAKDAAGHGTATAPGSLVAIFGTFNATTVAAADTIPYSTSLGGVSVTINGQNAPLQNVEFTGAFPFITAQVPFGVLGNQLSGNMNVVVTVNQTPSDPKTMPFATFAPGIFTIPANGQGNAVMVMTDGNNVGKIAAPNAAAVLNYPAAPIQVGGRAFFYATGLGVLTPAIMEGMGGLEGASSPGFVPSQVNPYPTVTIGGVPAKVEYAGVSGYPGVYQINIVMPSGVPSGGSVPVVIKSADGSVVSNTGTIAVQ
jgi:uncharacterized protein (TIGR03437 family)